MKKSIFQKDNTPHGSLREQPNMQNMFDGNIRTIPCSENNWKDGQELEEGRDYEIEWPMSSPNQIAVPIVQETEDEQRELWKEASEIIQTQRFYYGILKSKFTIQRRKQ